MMTSTRFTPTFLFDDDLPANWLMSRWEKYALKSILEAAQPKTAIEIGTCKGGSLQLISKYAEKVYSLDIDPECKTNLSNQFPNVEFLTGDSQKNLPDLLTKISSNKEDLGFVLIDADHSTEAVKGDINLVLQYVPKRPVYIVMHDSFHPPCRKGILTANWDECEYIHLVEVDFIPGAYDYKTEQREYRSMWGGFSLALMLPEKRIEPLTIHQCQKELFDTVFPNSRYARNKGIISWTYDLMKKVKIQLFG